MSLDDKLIEWLNELQIVSPAQDDERSFLSRSEEINKKSQAIAERIKQVFAAEGYEQTSSIEEDTGEFSARLYQQLQGEGVPSFSGTTILEHKPELMTGQEWYDRFEKELRMGARPGYAYSQSGMLRAAKRAANLAEDTN